MKTILRLVLLGVLFGSCTATWAQSAGAGTISGTVTDTSNAIISNASVTITNTDTGASRTLTANDAGSYVAALLQPGHYTVSVSAPNFGNFEQKNIQLHVGDTVTVDAPLPPASVQSTVQVSAASPLLDPERTEVSQVVSEKLVQNLPVNGRRWDDFVLLTPNVVNDGGSGLLSFHGISGLYNSNFVDGANNNQMLFSEARGRASGAPYIYSLDSIREFQVASATYSAEFGQAAGGQVNAITKSGTNQLHGDLFYYLRYPSLNALDPYNKGQGILNHNPLLLTQPIHQQQQFGGSVGGPILKDKLFGFFTYDGFRRVNPVLYSSTASISLTPAGAYGDHGNNITPAQCPSTITAGQCSNAIQYLQALSGSYPRTGVQDIFFPRLDWQINDRNHVFANFNFSNYHSPSSYGSNPSYSNSSVTTNGSTNFHERFVVAQWTDALTDHSVNEVRFQWGRDLETAGANAPAPSVSLTNVQTYGMPNALPRTAEPDEHRLQFTDVFSTTHGKHTLKFGGDLNLVHEVMINLYQGGGLYSYTKGIGPSDNFLSWVQDFFPASASDPLAGTHYDTFVQTIDQITGTGKDDFWMKMVDGFAEDSWKITHDLTLDLGVRYDVQLTPQPLHPNTSTPLTTYYNQTLKNVLDRVQPRIGFAWNPQPGTVVRGGYGMFSALNQGSTYYAMRVENGVYQTNYSFTGSGGTGGTLPTGAPLFPNVLFTPPGPALNSTPLYGVPTPASFGGAPSTVTPLPAGFKPVPSFHGLDPNFVPPLAHEMQLGVEQQMPGRTTLSVGYVGTRGLHLPTFVDANLIGQTPSSTKTYQQIDASGNAVGQSFTLPFYLPSDRRDSTIGSLNTGFSSVNSWYHSMAVTVKKPFENGLELLVNYTWAKAVDLAQVPGTYGTFYGSDSPLDPNNLKLESGRSDLDVRNRFVGSVVYQPQILRSNWYVKNLFDDFIFSGTATESTGFPVTASLSGYPKGGADGGVTGGLISSGSGTAANGRVPNQVASRNAFPGPGIRNIDFRVTRNFPITEKINFQILGEAFNLLNQRINQGVNTTGYSLLTAGAAGSGACKNFDASALTGGCIAPTTGIPLGTPTSTSSLLYGARQLQFSAKLFF
ncbi:TonB-dependent receptor [Acidobacterium sp. S8]|uniref:TonB-dependent receptor n=1 Tax=Acidobacterium sp. S8 TaxID=1641854 RepID=UPI00131D70DD|nr:TonB-dependent receptor [Acidobacterium sp. S8]